MNPYTIVTRIAAHSGEQTHDKKTGTTPLMKGNAGALALQSTASNLLMAIAMPMMDPTGHKTQHTQESACAARRQPSFESSVMNQSDQSKNKANTLQNSIEHMLLGTRQKACCSKNSKGKVPVTLPLGNVGRKAKLVQRCGQGLELMAQG